MENIVDENMDETIAPHPPAPPPPPPPITPPSEPHTATSSDASSKILKMPVKRKKANPIPRQHASTDEEKYGSEVWAHFVKFGSPVRAKCKYCSADYAADSKNSGTSNLHKHIRSCVAFQRILQGQQHNQTTMDEFCAKDVDGSSVMVAAKSKALDIEFLRESVAKFLMMDEKSFRTVEGPGFIQLMKAVEPRFILPSRTTVARDCFKLYECEKKKLKKFLKGRRLSLTTDCWTSNPVCA